MSREFLAAELRDGDVFERVVEQLRQHLAAGRLSLSVSVSEIRYVVPDSEFEHLSTDGGKEFLFRVEGKHLILERPPQFADDAYWIERRKQREQQGGG